MSIRSFVRASLVAGAAVAIAGAANADVFAKISSAPGDATQRGFEDQIVVTGANMSVNNMVFPDPEGVLSELKHQVSVGNITLSKAPDRSSPKLMQAAVNGLPLGTIELTFTSRSEKPGQPQQVDSKWIIEGAEVRSFNVFPDGANQPSENIEISYTAMRYQHFSKDGKGGRSMEEVKLTVPEDQIFAGDLGCR